MLFKAAAWTLTVKVYAHTILYYLMLCYAYVLRATCRVCTSLRASYSLDKPDLTGPKTVATLVITPSSCPPLTHHE